MAAIHSIEVVKLINQLSTVSELEPRFITKGKVVYSLLTTPYKNTMGRYLKMAWAVFYGRCFTIRCLLSSRIKTGKNLIIAKGTEIRARNNGKVILGENVKIGADSCISALNGGNVFIGNNVSIGSKCNIVSHEMITIGDGTIFAQNVNIYDHDHKFDAETGVHKREFKTSSIIIGKNCWIGVNAIILRGTTIGENCVVGAGCILKGKYPSKSIIIQKHDTSVLPISSDSN